MWTPPSPPRVGRTPGWSRATPGERSAALLALADRMEARAEEYARVETAQSGKPIKLTTEFDVPGSIDNVRFFAGAARVLNGMAQAEYDGTHTSSIRREPIGVVGSIAPWNYPLQMAMWKILPAVAAGNTIVLKPGRAHSADLADGRRGRTGRGHPGRRRSTC